MLLMLIGCTEPIGSQQRLERLDGTTVSAEKLEASIQEIMDKAGVAGLSLAVINDSSVVYWGAFGARDKDTGVANDEETVFAAASFSKTVFAYLVMLLAEEGVIDLDTPLRDYLGMPLHEHPRYVDLAGDERADLITARMVLSHTTGFPNWRFLRDDGRLVIMFEPSSRFSYSGEGIALLQLVIEEITRRGLEELAQELIFEPLGMSRTSYVWQEEFETNHAVPHDEYERSKQLRKRHEADAAGSMLTTAGDYARLLITLLDADGPRATTVDAMLEPQIAIRSRSMFGPGSRLDRDEDERTGLYWCLGWGGFESEQGRAFFHTGHDFGWQNYTVTYRDRGIGVVLMSNSDNFESVSREIAELAIADTYSRFAWLGYPRFDPNRRREPPPEPIAIDVEPEILEAYVGEYRFMGDRTVVVKMEEQRLYISTDAVDWAELLAESETRFFTTEDDTRFVFVLDDAGRVTGLTIEIDGIGIAAEKVR
jgi:CubicO group peptidase (beta-lactamase class C family)